MKKRHYIYIFVAIFSIPAFAQDLGTKNQIHESAVAVTGVGAADFVLTSREVMKEASPGIERAEKYGRVADTYDAARARLREKLAPELSEELKSIDKEIEGAKKPDPKLVERRNQIAEAIEKRVAMDHREGSFIRYRDQNLLREKKSMSEALQAIKKRSGRLIVGVGAVAAGVTIYEYTKDEKIDERQEAPALVTEAPPAEEEKVPNHIAAQLDAQEGNPF